MKAVVNKTKILTIKQTDVNNKKIILLTKKHLIQRLH